MKQLYKVLREDMVSPFQQFKYTIGEKYHCDNFDEDTTRGCSRGFYATELDGLPYSFRRNDKPLVLKCNVWGKEVEIDLYKRRYENIELIEIVPYPLIKKSALKIEPLLGYKLSEILFPVNPVRMKKVTEVNEKHLQLLTNWASVGDSVWNSVRDSVWNSVWNSVWDSVWDSVRDSVRDSVGNSVRDSVRDSVWDSVRDSVRDSVGNSVGGYVSSLFPNVPKWLYVNHKPGVNPFQSGIDLWKMGLVPSFDGTLWRLHSGPKMEIVYEGKL
jgi:hypothetical protein